MDDKFLIAEKYAQGLFSYARENNLVDQVMEDLFILKEAIAHVPEFLYWLSVPIIQKEEKFRFVSDVVQALKISSAVEWFLMVVIDKKRVEFLPWMIEKFRFFYNIYHHRVDVKIVTVRNLTDSERQLFLHVWGGYLNRWINLVEEVDPDLIGGIKVYFEGSLYDASIKKRLELLKEELVR